MADAPAVPAVPAVPAAAAPSDRAQRLRALTIQVLITVFLSLVVYAVGTTYWILPKLATNDFALVKMRHQISDLRARLDAEATPAGAEGAPAAPTAAAPAPEAPAPAK